MEYGLTLKHPRASHSVFGHPDVTGVTSAGVGSLVGNTQESEVKAFGRLDLTCKFRVLDGTLVLAQTRKNPSKGQMAKHMLGRFLKDAQQ